MEIIAQIDVSLMIMSQRVSFYLSPSYSMASVLSGPWRKVELINPSKAEYTLFTTSDEGLKFIICCSMLWFFAKTLPVVRYSLFVVSFAATSVQSGSHPAAQRRRHPPVSHIIFHWEQPPFGFPNPEFLSPNYRVIYGRRSVLCR